MTFLEIELFDSIISYKTHLEEWNRPIQEEVLFIKCVGLFITWLQSPDFVIVLVSRPNTLVLSLLHRFENFKLESPMRIE